MRVILIHGAWQGSWVWERFVPLLQAAGFETVAVDLPGNGTDDTPPGQVDLDLYVRHVGEIIGQQHGQVALIGHSGGGVVASQVAEIFAEQVAGIVYVAGMMLPDGVSYGDLVREAITDHPEVSGISPHLVWSADGLTSSVPPAAAIAHFLSDLPYDLASQAAAKLTPQPEGGRAVQPKLTADRFGRIPRLYVEATEDRSVLLLLQRRMQSLVPGARIASLATGHAPHVSAPEALAEAVMPFMSALMQTKQLSQ